MDADWVYMDAMIFYTSGWKTQPQNNITTLVFGKAIKNMKKDIKLITTEARTNSLVWEPNYHTTKSFSKIYKQ